MIRLHDIPHSTYFLDGLRMSDNIVIQIIKPNKGKSGFTYQNLVEESLPPQKRGQLKLTAFRRVKQDE